MSSHPLQASTRVNFELASSDTGGRIIIGNGDTYARYVVQVKAVDGTYETKEILISTDALLKISVPSANHLYPTANKIFDINVGAVEAYSKAGHIGVGFKGITYGKDADRGFSEMLRYGFYAMTNLARAKGGGTRLDLRSGYDYQRMTTVDGQMGARGVMDTALALHWKQNEVVGDFGAAEGNLIAHAGIDLDDPSNTDLLTMGFSASTGVRLIRVEDFEASLLAEISMERDGFREMLGLSKWDTVASLMFDVSYVYRDHHN
jgi:hypothetical protein